MSRAAFNGMNSPRKGGGKGGSASGSGSLQWRLGLVNHQGKYLTAETFGFKINASGVNMRKKQLWTLEHDAKEDDVVYIKSHLGRCLATDRRGNVTCNTEAKDKDEKFTIQYNPDGTGRWAVKSKTHGTYFGGTEDSMSCNEKQATQECWWTVRLAVHPQVNVKSLNRTKYARMEIEDPERPRIQFDELIPWGENSIITLEFCDGKYAVRTCDNRFLHREGHLVEDSSVDTLYNLEIRSGQYSGMALRDCTGRYLTAVGVGAVMQARNKTIGKDELFLLEDSHPQVFFTAHNGKMVSIKQGIDLTANQDELTDRETFQVEYDKKTHNWRLRTSDNKYWVLADASGIQAGGDAQSADGLFEIVYQEAGAIAIKAKNGRYITARLNGSLYAVSDAVTDKETFFITIVNRPLLVLKCDYGFVGHKSASNPRIECNKAGYDVIRMEHTNGQSGEYFLKEPNGKYWNVDKEGMINVDSTDPKPFLFELRGQSRFSIKAPNDKYIKGEQNGIFCAKAELNKATLWEF